LRSGVESRCTTSFIIVRKRQSSSDPLLARTRRLLNRYDLHARKRLGQHFLVCGEVLDTIMQAAELSSKDIALEVGPGLGVLTTELAKKAGYVIAVELDDKLAAMLPDTLASFDNIDIINRDILEVEPLSLLEELKPALPSAVTDHRAYKLVANLPYYITAPVLRHFLEAELKPQVMILTIQKEVAEAVSAEPGDMKLLSVSVQFYGKPEIICTVPAACFYPVPGVDSAVLKVMPYQEPVAAVTDIKGFFGLVRAGFCNPRKQLANSLSQGLQVPRPEAQSLLESADIKPERRAETLSVMEWVKLWQVYSRTGG
jgi:16S rRNA (adenine1518-N6/adenine1519-N6)-dimethyltransferase